MAINFRREGPLRRELKKWWEGLDDDRKTRAEFRRAKSVQEIIMMPSFYGAYNDFKQYFKEEKGWEDRLAMVLGLLSHIKSESDKDLAVQMATPPPNSQQPPVSELRFRRLIQCNRGELYVKMIHIIRLLGGKGNLYDTAQSCYFWGHKTKREWAFAYFPLVKDNKN